VRFQNFFDCVQEFLGIIGYFEVTGSPISLAFSSSCGSLLAVIKIIGYMVGNCSKTRSATIKPSPAKACLLFMGDVCTWK
jgi:hypothetical protein